MVNYARSAANAKTKIEAAGRAVTFQADVTAVNDAAAPYLGPDFSAGPTEETVIVVFVPASGGGLGQLAKALGATLKGFDQVALVAASSVTGDIYSFDRIVDTDGAVWKIDKRAVLAPGDTEILYELGLTRR